MNKLADVKIPKGIVVLISRSYLLSMIERYLESRLKKCLILFERPVFSIDLKGTEA